MADVKIHRRYSGDRHHVNNHSFDDSAHDWSSDENEEVIYSEKDARLPDIEEHDANDVAGLEEIDGDDPMNGDKHYGKHARQRGDHHRDVRFLTEGLVPLFCSFALPSVVYRILHSLYSLYHKFVVCTDLPLKQVSEQWFPLNAFENKRSYRAIHHFYQLFAW